MRIEEVTEVQEIAKKVIQKNYSKFFNQKAINWYINSGESDKEFIENFNSCFVLIEDNILKGFTIFFDNFIHLMMVDTNYQRGSLGSKLLIFAEKEIENNGYKKMNLEIFKENESALNFYVKNGWKVVSEKFEKNLGIIRVFLEKRTSAKQC